MVTRAPLRSQEIHAYLLRSRECKNSHGRRQSWHNRRAWDAKEAFEF